MLPIISSYSIVMCFPLYVSKLLTLHLVIIKKFMSVCYKWFTAKLPGKSAIATKYLKEENWYTVIPVGGDIPFNTDEEKQKIAEKYEKAYKEEIPFKINSV
ncbi:hypothetical protein [Bacillus sp. ISL-39]|uniref:hypothetical protein n=1 Tax=Bacillus sp. ISL-39 TaxID=2819124 RepID=UPI001BEA4F3A|nr:hypothetical protein [Bacillus sp. ISL-39]